MGGLLFYLSLCDKVVSKDLRMLAGAPEDAGKLEED